MRKRKKVRTPGKFCLGGSFSTKGHSFLMCDNVVMLSLHEVKFLYLENNYIERLYRLKLLTRFCYV